MRLKEEHSGEYTLSKLFELVKYGISKKQDKMGGPITAGNIEKEWKHLHGHHFPKSNENGPIWNSDEDTHWNVCELCNEKINIDSHQYVKDQTVENNGFLEFIGECSVCGRTGVAKRYEIAPDGEEKKWNYTLDDEYIILNTFNFDICNENGHDISIIVFPIYKINGKLYRTKFKNIIDDDNDRIKYIEMYTDYYRLEFKEGIDYSEMTDLNSWTFRMSINNNEIILPNDFDISPSNITYMGCLFSSVMGNLNLASFDTHSVTHMDNMFEGSSLESITFGDKFDTSQVIIMAYMFTGCHNLLKLDLTSFDTHKVTNMSGMFMNCTNLEQILVSRDKWIISPECNTTDMFRNCKVNHVTYIEDI